MYTANPGSISDTTYSIPEMPGVTSEHKAKVSPEDYWVWLQTLTLNKTETSKLKVEKRTRVPRLLSFLRTQSVLHQSKMVIKRRKIVFSTP